MGLNLPNRFLLTGTLNEISVTITEMSVRSFLSLDVGGTPVSCHYTISRKYHDNDCHRWIQTAMSLSPRADGGISHGGKSPLIIPRGDTVSRLRIGGNLYPWKDDISFYGESVGIAEAEKDSLAIEMCGVPLGGGAVMNAMYDSPRLFQIIRPPQAPPLHVVKMDLVYGCGWYYAEGKICPTSRHGLACVRWSDTGKTITDEKLKRLQKEWEIINE